MTKIMLALMLGVGLLASAHADNRVLLLDGSGNYARVADDTALRLTSGDYTLSAWVNAADADGSFQTIISKRMFSVGGWILRKYSGNKVSYVLEQSGDPKIQGSINLQSDRWYHIAVTYKAASTTGILYCDGVVDGSNAALPSPTSSTTYQLEIGRDRDGGDDYWRGKIDDVRVWNRCLTQAEVRGLMHEKLTGQELGLLAYWTFDDGTGNDSSPNNRDATLYGATPRTEADPTTTNGIANAVEVYFNSGSPMTRYSLEATPDLLSPNWTATGAQALGNGTEQSMFDSTRARSQMFYRVVSE